MYPYSKSEATLLGSAMYLSLQTDISTDSYSFSTRDCQKSLEGYKRDNWRELVSRNTQAGTYMLAREEFLQLVGAHAVRNVTAGKFVGHKAPYFFDSTAIVDGQYRLPVNGPAGKLPNGNMSAAKAERQALSRFWAHLRQQRTNMQAGVTAGEAAQSARGIGDLAQSLARNFGDHIRQQRKLIVRHIGNFVVGPNGSAVRDPSVVRRVNRLPATTREYLYKEIREGYLQFALGIRPLVKDVKDLAETLARWQFDTRHTRIRGYGSDSQQLFTRMTFDGGPGGAYSFNGVETKTRYETVEVIYRGGLLADTTSPAAGSAHRLYQLMGAYDLENWIPTIWNLLPWSFVVDYVTNVADVVTAMVTDTSNVRWVMKTVRREVCEEVSIAVPYRRTFIGMLDHGELYGGKRPSYSTETGSLGGYNQKTRVIVRTPQSGITLPTLTFNLPQDKGLTIPNLIALFSGRAPNRDYSRGD